MIWIKNGHKHHLCRCRLHNNNNNNRKKLFEWVCGMEWNGMELSEFRFELKWPRAHTIHIFQINRQKSPEEVTKISALRKFIAQTFICCWFFSYGFLFCACEMFSQWKMFAGGEKQNSSPSVREEEEPNGNVNLLMLLLQQLP